MYKINLALFLLLFSFFRTANANTCELFLSESKPTAAFEQLLNPKDDAAESALKVENAFYQKLIELEIEPHSFEKIGIGISEAQTARLSDGTKVVYKSGYAPYGATPNAEVAAYLLDRHLGRIVNVPTTALRTTPEGLMSAQLFIENATPTKVVTSGAYRRNLDFFDFIIDNSDRRAANLLTDPTGRIFAIDNGMGFRSVFALQNWKFLKVEKENYWSIKLSGLCRRILGPGLVGSCVKDFVLKRLPSKEIYEKFKNTTDRQYFELFENVLSPSETYAFLKRRKIFVDTVEAWLKQTGRTEYPIEYSF